MTSQIPSANNQPCTECQAGQMGRQFITYFTWLGDELITVPDFPAWVCDVCGKTEYDIHALARLSLLLSPNAGKPNQQKRTIRRSPKSKTKRTSTTPPK